jgi:pimeloyl-ACP methyl ester carboxylesterase
MTRSRINTSFAAAFLLLVAEFTHAASTRQTEAGDDSAPQSQFHTVDGVKIHYWVQGSGEPVVLVHAWLSNAEANWIRPGTMAQLASHHHQVIALDLAGYGQSDTPDSPTAYGDGWVEQIKQLMDHLHIPKAHIVGYSMGGMIALKFIVLHPDRTLSGLLGGMGYLEAGGENQQTWTNMRRVQSRGAAQLALTPDQVNSVHVPVEIVVGSRDPVRDRYVAPLLKVRSDWPVVEIPRNGHISTVMAQGFKDEIVRWTAPHGAE